MKALLTLCLAASAWGVAFANEPRHSATFDMPKVISLTHASPDTWHTLPPIQANDWPTSNLDARKEHAANDFEQQHRHGLGTELGF